MAIRKQGAVTGEVTGVEAGSLPGKAAVREQDAPGWGEADDRALQAENSAADRDDD